MADVLQKIVREPRLTKSRLRLALQSESGLSKVWVIVEGGLDSFIFSRMLASSINIGVKEDNNTGGYAVVELIVSEISKTIPKANVCGIRDKDFLKYLNPPHLLPDNVFLTDRSDIEMTLVASESVQNALEQIPNYIKAHESVVPLLRQLGYERIYCGCNHLRIHADNIRKMSRLWDDHTQTITSDWKNVCISMFEKESNCSELNLNSFVSQIGLEEESDFDIIRGHDYIKYISKALVNTALYSEDYLVYTMAVAYSKEDFHKTQLFQSLLQWQNTRGVAVVNAD